MSPALRQIGSIILIVVGGIALVGGILERYADRNLLDPERFAERAVSVLDDEGAQKEIANVIVNELEKQGVDRSDAQKAVNENIGTVTQNEEFREALTVALVVANEAALGNLEEDVSRTGLRTSAAPWLTPSARPHPSLQDRFSATSTWRSSTRARRKRSSTWHARRTI